jgi:hypothetical protein
LRAKPPEIRPYTYGFPVKRDTLDGKRVGVLITGGNADLDKSPWH